MQNKTILVLGGSGFLGQNLIKKLSQLGNEIVSVDIQAPTSKLNFPYRFLQFDLRCTDFIKALESYQFDEIYQLAADMGGAGYVFSGENDADILLNSTQINLNLLKATQEWEFNGIVFFASSACIYPIHTQLSEFEPDCREELAYPANPDSDYGWEKLYAERMFTAFRRNKNLSIRIARLHNIYGPFGIYDGGKEKAPGAICRKVAKAKDNGYIEIWGNGEQTRSFLYIDDAIEAILKLMESDFQEPINIGSIEMVSINELANIVIEISGKNLGIQHIEGPIGVRGRNSNNDLIESKIGWKPSISLRTGMKNTFEWIEKKIAENGF